MRSAVFTEGLLICLAWSATKLLAVTSGESDASKSGHFTTACMESTTGYQCDNPYTGAFWFEDDDGQVVGTGVNGRNNESMLCHNATTPAQITTPEIDFSRSGRKCVKYAVRMYSDFEPDSLIVYILLSNGQHVVLKKGSEDCKRQNCCRNEAVPECYLRTVAKTRVSHGKAKVVIELLPKLDPGKLCVFMLTVNTECGR